MKLIVITPPVFQEGEADSISGMLDSGLISRVHIRKPNADFHDVGRLIGKIPRRLYPFLSIHYHHRLAEEFSLGGIHLSGSCPLPPENFSGLVSRSCHSLDELSCSDVDYNFLSPIFDSISKSGYVSNFSAGELRGAVDDSTVALGGVEPYRIPLLRDLGFGGAAFLGAAWNCQLNSFLEDLKKFYG